MQTLSDITSDLLRKLKMISTGEAKQAADNVCRTETFIKHKPHV